MDNFLDPNMNLDWHTPAYRTRTLPADREPIMRFLPGDLEVPTVLLVPPEFS